MEGEEGEKERERKKERERERKKERGRELDYGGYQTGVECGVTHHHTATHCWVVFALRCSRECSRVFSLRHEAARLAAASFTGRARVAEEDLACGETEREQGKAEMQFLDCKSLQCRGLHIQYFSVSDDFV